MSTLINKLIKILTPAGRVIDVGGSCSLQYLSSDRDKFTDASGRSVVLKNITRSGGYAFVYYILGDLRWEGGAEVSDDEKSNIAKLIGQYYMRENLSALMILDHRKEAFVPISDSDKTVI